MRARFIACVGALAAAAVGLVVWLLRLPGGHAQAEHGDVTVQTNSEPVARYVSLPGIIAVRWVERPRVPRNGRDPFPIGPADSVMTAFVELDPSVWPALDRALGGPKESRTEPIDESWASTMLTPGTIGRLRRENGVLIAEERRYDITSIRKGPRAGGVAWRIGDGLLMSFYTR